MSTAAFGLEALRWFQCKTCPAKLPSTGEGAWLFCSTCQVRWRQVELLEVTSGE